MRKKNQKRIWSFHIDFDNEDCCLLGCNNFICGKYIGVAEKLVAWSSAETSADLYHQITRCHIPVDSFLLREEEADGGLEEEKAVMKIRNGGI